MSETMRDFNRIILESNELYHDAARAFGLSDSLFWILYSLRDCGGALTQTELVRRMCMPKQTVNSALKNLLRDGLIAVEEGRRAKPVMLTEKGEAFCRKTIDIVRAQEESALRALSDEEQTLLLSLFSRWTQSLQSRLDEALPTISQNTRKGDANEP